MFNGCKILVLIPARGGSKGPLGKNLRILCGRPLICHSIETALKSDLIDRVIVSTDSREIAEISKEAGAEVPFLRPAHLAEDLTPDLPVVQHCLSWCKDQERYVPEFIVFLRPTGPLRTVEEIEEAIRMLEADPEADSVRSVIEPSGSPYKMFESSGRFLVPFIKQFKGAREFYAGPRQALPKVYQSVPDIHVLRTSIVKDQNSIIGSNILPFFLNRPTVDIDNEFDLEIAEYLMKKRLTSPGF